MDGGSADHAGAVIYRPAGDCAFALVAREGRPQPPSVGQTGNDLAAVSLGVDSYSASTASFRTCSERLLETAVFLYAVARNTFCP
jgi:hypothetical protein